MMLRRHSLLIVTTLIAMLVAGCDFFVSADQRVSRAQELMAVHDYRGAMIELKNALQSQSDNVQARLLLAQVSLQLGDAAAADKELRYAIDAGADVARTAPLAAEIRLASGRASELLVALEAGELPLPEPARSTYRGRALLDVRQPEQALEAFQAAIAADASYRQARLGLADAYAALGRIDEALAEFDKILQADPQAADVLLARGTLHVRRGQVEQAEQSLSAALQHAETLPVRQYAMLLAALTEAHLARGDIGAARKTQGELAAISQDAPITRLLSARVAMAEHDYAKAATDLQRVVSAAPNFAPARFMLGAVSLAQGNLHQAELHLSQAVQRAPENLEARKLLAQAQLRLERPDAAVQSLLGSDRPDAGDGQVEALLGVAHLQLGDETKGLELLKRSIANNPGNRALKLELAAAYLRSGAHAEAIELVRSVEHVGGDVQRERLLITAVAAQQGIQAARAEVENLVEQFPNDVGVLNLAGAFLAAQGEVERARALLGRAAKIDPKDVGTLVSRARVEMRAGDAATGIGWLEQALKIDPKNVTARMLFADLALRSNDAAGAVKSLEEARSQDEKAIEPRLQLARLHFRERRAKQADEVLNELLTIADNRADIVNSVGLVELEAGRYHEALARFRAATDIASDDPGYWLNVARAQLALGHSAVAREALQKSVSVRPNWVPAVSTLAMLDLSEGRSEAALARAAELRRAAPRDPAVLMFEGDLYAALKRYADAARAFDAAAQLQPSAAAALKSYKVRQVGRLGDTAVPLESWLKRQPDDFAVRTVLAEAYRLSEQRSRAVEQYELIVSNGPLNVAALNNLAWLYHETGDGRAEAMAQRAHAAAPDAPAVADTYGWILVQAGKPAAGLPILKQAAAKANGQPDIQYHYA
ncbi:MAG: XrtA/PEP-CTERM system TPR-repeat protein PrsT, partial [Steroidobacteraceae bacterium]